MTKAKCGACINSFRQGDFTLMEEWVSLTEADLKEIGLKKGTIMRFKKHFHKDWEINLFSLYGLPSEFYLSQIRIRQTKRPEI